MSKDTIYRQDAIDALDCISGVEEVLRSLPSAQPEMNMDEWCTDCKEYDHEKHCCPRFNRVIRQALKDAQPEVIRCKDCKHHWTHRCMDSMPTEICELGQTFYDANADFCSLAERRTE